MEMLARESGECEERGGDEKKSCKILVAKKFVSLPEDVAVECLGVAR
jgi:hypothetical protein